MTEAKRASRRYPKAQRDHAIAYLIATGCRIGVVARDLGIPRGTLETWAETRLGTTSQKTIQQKRAAGDYGSERLLSAWLKDKLKAGKHFVLTS